MEKLNRWLSLIGNLGVVVGIFFLAYEIQANTNAVHSATYEAYNEAASSWWDYRGQHAAALAPLIGETEQQIILAGLQMKMFNTMEATFLHHRAGVMDDDVFEGKIHGFQAAMKTEIHKVAWRQMQGAGFSRGFQQFMETDLITAEMD